MGKVKCKFCLYEWIARVKKPKQCTRCKRYDCIDDDYEQQEED